MNANDVMAPAPESDALGDCLFCRKAEGREEQPIGGYIVDDGEWLANHAHPEVGDAGTLVLSSRRHFLDFADLTEQEAASFHRLLRKLFPAIKCATGAERVYLVSMMANQPHFHVWLVPQAKGATLKAFQLLASRRSTTTEAVEQTAEALRTRLQRQ